jgi:phosphatidylglycerophosphate synthase
VPKVPKFMGTKFLTLTTFLWGPLVVLTYYLSKINLNFLWLVSFWVLMQWVTDLLDGGVGRYRNEGFIKWGFYMDHFTDYFFMCCVVIGLFTLINNALYLLIAISIIGMFFISTFLRFGALNAFSTSFLGFSPAEMRLLVIFTNILLYFFSIALFSKILFAFIILTGVLLIYNIYKTQKEINKIDIKVS